MNILSIFLAATIARVFAYNPAPGQFVNTLPQYEQGDDAETMRLKAEEYLKEGREQMISLGGWGGYIVFGFDHEVPNISGEYDLKILGNAYYAAAKPDSVTRLVGSSEPGIVLVSHDDNGNGLPDDTWYELAGSEYPRTMAITMTYYRPDSMHTPAPSTAHPFITDSTYIHWIDNRGQQGYMPKNSFHTQDYFPLWLSDDSVTFSGSLLPPNAVDSDPYATTCLSYCYDYGYVDNQPNEAADAPERHVSEFMLDWAVDSLGHSVQLDGIHFVKVYSAVRQYNGWQGECSTEIVDAWDMHAKAQGTELVSSSRTPEAGIVLRHGHLFILRSGVYYTLQGAKTRPKAAER